MIRLEKIGKCARVMWNEDSTMPMENIDDLEIDSNLNFDLYVSSLCKKVGKRLSVLA